VGVIRGGAAACLSGNFPTAVHNPRKHVFRDFAFFEGASSRSEGLTRDSIKVDLIEICVILRGDSLNATEDFACIIEANQIFNKYDKQGFGEGEVFSFDFRFAPSEILIG
jgi:hypothetical protein